MTRTASILAVAAAAGLLTAATAATSAVTVTITDSKVTNDVILSSGTGSGTFDYAPGALTDPWSVTGSVSTLTPPNEAKYGSSPISVSSNGATGDLTLIATFSGLTSPAGAINLLSGFTENTADNMQVTEQTFINGTLLGSGSFTNIGSSSVSSVDTVSAPYTVTEEYVFAPLKAGEADSSSTINVNVSATPEPGAWALMLCGLFGIGAALRSSRNRRLSVVPA
jgi:hypothetical protein